jgi:hypothetical protein
VSSRYQTLAALRSTADVDYANGLADAVEAYQIGTASADAAHLVSSGAAESAYFVAMVAAEQNHRVAGAQAKSWRRSTKCRLGSGTVLGELSRVTARRIRWSRSRGSAASFCCTSLRSSACSPRARTAASQYTAAASSPEPGPQPPVHLAQLVVRMSHDVDRFQAAFATPSSKSCF